MKPLFLDTLVSIAIDTQYSYVLSIYGIGVVLIPMLCALLFIHALGLYSTVTADYYLWSLITTRPDWFSCVLFTMEGVYISMANCREGSTILGQLALFMYIPPIAQTNFLQAYIIFTSTSDVMPYIYIYLYININCPRPQQEVAINCMTESCLVDM